MKTLLRSTVFLLLTGALLSAGCSSKEEETPKPVQLGSISGVVSPAGAAVRVTAVGPDGRAHTATPDATGTYTIANLPAGSYQLSTSPLGRFQPRNTVQVTLSSYGFPVQADSLLLTLRSRIVSGTMTWTADGQTYTATSITGSTDEVLSRQFHLFGTVAKAPYPQTYPEVYLSLVSNYHGVGIYPIQGAPSLAHYHLLRFYPPDSNAILAEYYSVQPTAGTITITANDPAQGLLSGTFNFDARTTDLPGGPQTVHITNGSFSVRF